MLLIFLDSPMHSVEICFHVVALTTTYTMTRNIICQAYSFYPSLSFSFLILADIYFLFTLLTGFSIRFTFCAIIVLSV